MFVIVSVIVSRGNAVSDSDILAYSVFTHDDGATLYLYDTSNDQNTVVYQSDKRLHFAFSSNGHIAFSTGWFWKNNGELFIMDTTNSVRSLVNLSYKLNMLGYPLGWSYDGKYLAFASVTDGGQQQSIYVWDGITATDITPQNTLGNPQSYDIAWGPDGRLAFTVWFGASNHDFRSEIYIWDSKVTFNLSQNADAEDREPIWNTDGEIAFGSTLDNEYVLLLWDGTSYTGALPDVSSFTRIAPQLNVYAPFSVWVNNDLLVFEATAPQDSHFQVYAWDRRTLSNISQNPDSHNGSPQWAWDGYWAFSSFFSDQQRLNVRNEHNVTVFETDSHSNPAWSSGGSLVFCNRNNTRNWKLSRWNRASVSTLIQGDEIFAQWRSGQRTACSNG